MDGRSGPAARSEWRPNRPRGDDGDRPRSWDLDAYGSVVWLVLGLHTTHLATDVADTIVLTVLMFTCHAKPRRFSDVTDNVFYWNFVVVAWLPLYFLLDWTPRL
jgi:cytochrome c oxidase subunit 3